ncbi:uncharacterized protein [Ptychodera flava]|uniref:uncharacterized protein n=1 Tax=Ptychodera flava TaxID=63121 RepID=UPI00396A4673
MILLKSAKFKEVFQKLIKFEVRQEITKYLKKGNVPASAVTASSIKGFHWANYLYETRKNMPLIHAVLEATLTNRRNTDKVGIDSDGKVGEFVPALGFIIATILNLRKPRKFHFLQTLNALQMYRSGCNQKLFTWCHKIGICLKARTTRNTVDRLRKDFDTEIMGWKKNIQNELLSTVEDTVDALSGDEYGTPLQDMFESESETYMSETDSSDTSCDDWQISESYLGEPFRDLGVTPLTKTGECLQIYRKLRDIPRRNVNCDVP